MIELNFTPFPNLETERLYLRRIIEEDKNEMFALRSDKNIMQFIARPLMKTVEEVVTFINSINESIEKKEYINWGLALKSNNKLIGTIGFYRLKKEDYRAEVGYMLHTSFQKQGIMQEVMPVVLDFGFKQMKLHSIEAVIDPRNKASENVLLKQGFVKEAHFKENLFFNGEFLDSAHYSLLAKK